MFFHFGSCFFVFPYWLPLFVCCYILEIDLLWLSVFVWWSYIVCVLCGPVVKYPSCLGQGASGTSLVRVISSLHCFWPFNAWSLPSGWLIMRPITDHSVWSAVQTMTIWSIICLNRLWCLVISPFGYVTCESYLFLLWSFSKSRYC